MPCRVASKNMFDKLCVLSVAYQHSYNVCHTKSLSLTENGYNSGNDDIPRPGSASSQREAEGSLQSQTVTSIHARSPVELSSKNTTSVTNNSVGSGLNNNGLSLGTQKPAADNRLAQKGELLDGAKLADSLKSQDGAVPEENIANSTTATSAKEKNSGSLV